jgi:hypothetical protein
MRPWPRAFSSGWHAFTIRKVPPALQQMMSMPPWRSNAAPAILAQSSGLENIGGHYAGHSSTSANRSTDLGGTLGLR